MYLCVCFQSLRPALLNVREMCHRISEMGLCQIDKDHTYTLTEFREAQFNQLNDVSTFVFSWFCFPLYLYIFVIYLFLFYSLVTAQFNQLSDVSTFFIYLVFFYSLFIYIRYLFVFVLLFSYRYPVTINCPDPG